MNQLEDLVRALNRIERRGRWSERLSNYSYSPILNILLLLPRCRALWVVSSNDNSRAVYDISGQGRTLTAYNSPTFSYTGMAPYTDYVRASSMYHGRADAAPLDIGISGAGDNGLTILAFAQFHAESIGNITGIVSKWNTTGNLRAYRLVKNANDTFTFGISSDGTATTVATSTSTASAGTTYFLAGRWTPSSEVAVFVNGTSENPNTTSIPANTYNSTDPLYLARTISAGTSEYLDGRLYIAVGLYAYPLDDDHISAVWGSARHWLSI